MKTAPAFPFAFPFPFAVTLALALATAPGARAAAEAPPPATDEPVPVPAYWHAQREGWFWYRDPPKAAQPPAPAPAAARPAELAAFEALQERLETLKRIAVMNPTDANLGAYLRFQRSVMDRAERFARRWQQLVWRTPELDYGLAGRPTNAAAITAYDEQARQRQAGAIRALAATHALLFVFRAGCPYCHRLAPVLKQFERDYGMAVYAVSLDGSSLPEYPQARTDPALASTLAPPVVPALYLAEPARRDIRPVGFGVLALTELAERVAALAQPDPL